MIAYPDASIIDQLYLARLRAGTPIDATGLLTRFRVKSRRAARRSLRETLSPVPLELPRINYEAHAGKPYRYVWGTGIALTGDFLDSIVKIDAETGDGRTLVRGQGFIPASRCSSPRLRATAEDDGVLLSVVLDIANDRSFLLVLDAATLDEMARAEAPHAIPFHFHGNYFAGA